MNHREILREHLKEEKLHAKKMKVFTGETRAMPPPGNTFAELWRSSSPSQVGAERRGLPLRISRGWICSGSAGDGFAPDRPGMDFSPLNSSFLFLLPFFVSMLCPCVGPAGRHQPVPGRELSAKPGQVRAGRNSSLGGGSRAASGEDRDLGRLCLFSHPAPGLDLCPRVLPEAGLCSGHADPAWRLFLYFLIHFFLNIGFSSSSSGGRGPLWPLRVPAWGLGTPIYPQCQDLGVFQCVGRLMDRSGEAKARGRIRLWPLRSF